MILHLSGPVRKAAATMTVVAMVTGAALLIQPGQASAHCDSAQGPVVTAAKKTLETGEIKWALAYVQADAEAEMTAAFNYASEVRKVGGEARALADRYFEETTVRLHRVGEGASYTGIKENPEITPGLEAAEKAVETGNLDDAKTVLDKAVKAGIEEYWHKVVEARKAAEAEDTVPALREKAESELIFEKFVFGVEQAAKGLVGGEEGSAAGGHSHGAPAQGEDHRGAPAEHHGEEGERPVSIHLKGAELPIKGVSVNGKALVPLRAISEALGGQVTWEGVTRTVIVKVGAKELIVKIDNLHAGVNGKEIALPVAPVLHEERTMVPGHLMADFLGLEFTWNLEKSIVEYVGPK